VNAIALWIADRAQLCAGILVGICASFTLRKIELKKVAPWLKKNASRLTFGSCGFFLGVLFALCFREKPTDAIASLIGAFAGIVAAIAGGLWLWEEQEKRSVERVVKAVDTSLGFLISSMASACSYARDHASTDIVRGGFIEVKESIRRFVEDYKIYGDHLFDLPAELQIAHAMFMRATVEIASDIGAADSMGWRSHYCDRVAIVTADDLIGSIVNKIGRSLPSMRALAPFSNGVINTLSDAVHGYLPTAVVTGNDG